MKFENSLSFAKRLDAEDPLKALKNRFYNPVIRGNKVVYFCGNSLGLQPKTTKKSIEQELAHWAALAVEGHFTGKTPWLSYHKQFARPLSRLLGAKPSEVVAMNSLTVNIHLLLASFYRPEGKRTKIITEKGAFSSDTYALNSQIELHRLVPDEHLIEVAPRPGSAFIEEEDIFKAIEETGEELALVFLGAVNYYSGQFFDLKKITEAAHKAGALAGYDLAHSIGNTALTLSAWDVDFAAWCSYKYLNSGPGAVGGIYVNDRLGKPETFRLAGWWGNSEADRFEMKPQFSASTGAEGWQLSNAPVLSMAAHRAALEIFEEAGMKNLAVKSRLLTGFLEYLIKQNCIQEKKKKSYSIKIISPSDPKRRGAQLSIDVEQNGRKLFDTLIKEGFIVDWRSPSVIRVSPVPLYNSFQEVYRFAKRMSELCVMK